MEAYEKPMMEVVELENVDIITTSCPTDCVGNISGDPSACSAGGFPGMPGVAN